jgi:CheY-like chemotaxis protein
MDRHPCRRPARCLETGRPHRLPACPLRWSRRAGLELQGLPPHGLALTDPGDSLRPILIVEDDDFGRETLGHILETDGHRVLCAADGDDALEQMRGRPTPGLILLDLFMPGLTGWRFLSRLRNDPEYRDVPVVLISSASADEMVGGAGIVARFEKPIAVDALLATIRRYVEPE